MSFFRELQRRNVVRVGVAYTVTAWLLLQVSDTVMESIGAPDWVMQALLYMLVVGAFPVLAFSWVYEITPEGVKREADVPENESIVLQTRRKLDWLIMVLLLGAIGYLYWNGSPRMPVETPATASAPAEAGETNDTAASASTSDQRSIAVLPFVNLSSDSEQEYFSDGISEELLNALSQIEELRVAARTSSFLFKEDQRPIREIAELLNVNHVLEGSVRKAGSRLRITAQLIEADTGYHLWSNSYDRELTDVFAVQDEIATAIAEALSIAMDLERGGKGAIQPSEIDPRAYDWFLQGRELISTANQRDRREGVNLLEKAILIEPDFLPARALLVMGLAFTTDGFGGDLSLEEFMGRAVPEIAHIESTDKTLPELWRAKSIVAEKSGDWVLALNYADRALALRPSYTRAFISKDRALEKLLRPRDQLQNIEQWLAVDPLSIWGRFAAAEVLALVNVERAEDFAADLMQEAPLFGNYARAMIARYSGQDAEDLRHGLMAVAVEPESYFARQAAWIVLAVNGFAEEAGRLTKSTNLIDQGIRLFLLREYEEAETVLRRALRARPSSRLALTVLAHSVYVQGRYEEASAIFRNTLVEVPGGLSYASGGAGPQHRGVYAIHAFREAGDALTAEKLTTAFDRYFSELEAMGSPTIGVVMDRAILEGLKGRDDVALNYLVTAVEQGAGAYWTLDSPVFDSLNGNAAFEAARAQALENYERGRAEMRTLMCKNNPIPDVWQPLESTCAGR